MSATPEQPREAPAPPSTSGKAIASFVLGILSFCMPLIAALPGVIAGAWGLADIRRSQGLLRGRGLAIVGILLSLVATLVVWPTIVLTMLLPAIWDEVNQDMSMRNLQALVQALHNYHDTNGSFPPAVVRDERAKPLYSWRVMLLPFLGQSRLHDRFKLDEPWDSPANKLLLAEIPREYAPVGENFPPADYATHCMVFDGKEAVFWSGTIPDWLDDPKMRGVLQGMQIYSGIPGLKPLYNFGSHPRLTSITDGPANTILVVEADERVPWTKPQDAPYDKDQPLPKLGGLHRRGFAVALADGAVRMVSNRTSEKTIRAAITSYGGEILGPDWNAP